MESDYQFQVNVPPLTAHVHLRYDRRYSYIRVGDYIFDAQISAHPELAPLTPNSTLLPILDLLLHQVS